ncbi:MAG: hypothetical protein KF893_02830 [Caldilineaceae bacterium]|nr:hypothetical protein [Caldilineaceae bacterium]
MKSNIDPQDILRDIEFELLQGAIRQDELGQSLQAVRKFHSNLRTELLAVAGDTLQGREIITRQTQFNDMLLSLLQEMSSDLLRLEQQQRDLGLWLPNHAALDLEPCAQNDREESQPSTLPKDTTDTLPEEWLALARSPSSAAVGNPLLMPAADQKEVEQAMQAEALSVPIHVRGANIPVIGAILHKMRRTLHNLVYYYVNQLAGRQVQVNQTFGAALLRLMAQNAEQQQEIERLRSELANNGKQ